MQAMILAAGFGTRLMPHTLVRPKPLFPILNTPLLILTIRRLKRLGFTRIVVNCHHLREQIVAVTRNLDGVVVQQETEILGTGGGLSAARQLFDDGPVLVTNGDIYHTIDLVELYGSHLRSGRKITLAMHDFPRFNKVEVKHDEVVSFDQQEPGGTKLAYTGVQVLDQQVLEGIRTNSPSCIIDHYRYLLQQGIPINTELVSAFWTDMGTEGDYLQLHQGLLNGSIPRWQELGSCAGEQFFSRHCTIAADAQISGWCAIGDSNIGSVRLANVVVWDGLHLDDGFEAANALISESHAAGFHS